jgi:hypothetical protein
MTYLSLRGKEISEIIPDTFEKLCSLEVLHLDKYRINHMERDLFNGLVNLKKWDCKETTSSTSIQIRF